MRTEQQILDMLNKLSKIRDFAVLEKDTKKLNRTISQMLQLEVELWELRGMVV